MLAALQQPPAQILAAPPAAAPSTAGTVSIGVLLIVILGFLIWMRRKHTKPVDMIFLFSLGVLMSATLFGKIVQQVLGGIGQGIAPLLSTMVGSG